MRNVLEVSNSNGLVFREVPDNVVFDKFATDPLNTRTGVYCQTGDSLRVAYGSELLPIDPTVVPPQITMRFRRKPAPIMLDRVWDTALDLPPELNQKVIAACVEAYKGTLK